MTASDVNVDVATRATVTKTSRANKSIAHVLRVSFNTLMRTMMPGFHARAS